MIVILVVVFQYEAPEALTPFEGLDDLVLLSLAGRDLQGRRSVPIHSRREEEQLAETFV